MMSGQPSVSRQDASILDPSLLAVLHGHPPSEVRATVALLVANHQHEVNHHGGPGVGLAQH